MAHIGTIARNGLTTKDQIIGYAWSNNGAHGTQIALEGSGYGPRYALRSITTGVDVLIINSGSDNTQGSPDVPSLKMGAMGTFKFRWSVINGARSISVRVKQAVNQQPRPLLRVKANPSIGILSDGTAVAASGTDWVTIGTIAVNPTSNGALYVVLENRYDGQTPAAPCYWDHIVTT